MNCKYSIKDLEQLSGIKAHTIRIWEQRYELIKPKRTETNIRFYEDCDVRKLLNVSFLVHEGVKISKVAKLNDTELCQLVSEKSNFKGEFNAEVNALKMAMFEFDDKAFNNAFAVCLARYGEENTFADIIGGFIAELGMLWQTQTITVAHEHFVSNLIKQKLYAATDRLKVEPKTDAKKYLLFLPADELHEIGLLYIQYILKRKGEKIVFLGQSTPFSYLIDVQSKTPFDIGISVFTTAPHSSSAEDYLNEANKWAEKNNVKFMFCGPQLHKLIENQFETGSVSIFKNMHTLLQLLS